VPSASSFSNPPVGFEDFVVCVASEAGDVSTLEEELRKLAAGLEEQRRRKVDVPAEVARQEAKQSKRNADRVRYVAQEYFETAAILQHDHHDLRGWAAGTWFTLEVDGWPSLQANLESEIWCVTIWNRRANAVRSTYESDDALLMARDELIELLADSNAQSFANSTKQPTTQSERRTSLFNLFALPWSRSIGAPSAAPQVVKLAVYVIAFGTGIAFSHVLIRHASQLPAAPGMGRPGVSQDAVAPVSSGVPHSRSNSHARATSPARVVRPPTLRTAGLPPMLHRAPLPHTSGLIVRAGPKTTMPEAAPSSSLVIPAPGVPAVTGTAPQAAGRSTRFHVRVGVFDTRDTARALVKRLESLGYAAASTEDGVYRVWVGGYVDRETAERLAMNLRKAGFDAALEP
jgi:cell division septation protein DedD